MAILTDENYVDKAENVITRLKKKQSWKIPLDNEQNTESPVFDQYLI